MALIFHGSTPCSLCGQVLQETDNIVAWKAFLPQDHRFWPYSDSGMHRDCFLRWEHRDAFVRLYQYQPLVDFDDPATKTMIEQYGMPEWLNEIAEYRKNHPEDGAL